MRNARSALDLAKQNVFLVCACHVGAAVHLRKIRVRAGEGDAAVTHRRILGAVDEHLRLFRALGVGQQQTVGSHLRELQRVFAPHLGDAHHRGQADRTGDRDHIRDLARGKRAVLAVDDEKIEPVLLQELCHIGGGKCGHHRAQQMLAGV